jgi:hypothetical protein
MLKNLDVESTLRRLAEKRIEDAMKEGKFDNLPGAGKPLELEPAPADENARLMWWALRILRNNEVVPDEVKWRKQIALMKLELSKTLDENRLRFLVVEINALVNKLNTMGTNAINIPVTIVDEAGELAKLRRRRLAVR